MKYPPRQMARAMYKSWVANSRGGGAFAILSIYTYDFTKAQVVIHARGGPNDKGSLDKPGLWTRRVLN